MGIIDDYLNSSSDTPAPSSKASSGLIERYLNSPEVTAAAAPAIKIRPVAPPISGATQEQSDAINAQPAQQGGANPREWLPKTNIQESAYNADKAGADLISSGTTDYANGHPYKAVGKVALGGLARLASPMTGIIEGGIATPITDITGNPDIGDRAGLVVGSALPAVPGASAVIKALPKNKALKTLVESIGPENLPSVVSAMKANPRLSPADLSPKVLQDTQHLFTQDGKHINYLADTSANRMASAKGVVKDAYDASTGLPVDAVTKLAEMKKVAQAVGSKEINPALAGAKPVDVSPVLEHIDNIVNPNVNQKITSKSTLPSTDINEQLTHVRSLLANSKEQRTNPQALHEFQSAIRETADGLLNSSSASDRRMGNALMNVRGELVDAIDKASGGKYKPALSNYRDAKHIDDAFHNGYDSVFTNSKKMEGRPEFTKEWFDGLSASEKEAAKQGARLRLDSEINTVRSAASNPARKAMDIPEIEFNRQKMETLFGKAETDKLLTTVQHERAIANTHNKVIEGSQTAMRAASKEKFTLPTPTEVGKGLTTAAIMETGNVMAGGMGGVGSAIYAGLKAGNYVKDKTKLALAREHNARYATYALPTEGPSRDALIQSLEAQIPGPKQSLLTRAGAKATSLGRLVAP